MARSREEYNAYAREWYWKNREHILEKQKKSYTRKLTGKRYYLKHKKKISGQRKLRYLKNKDREIDKVLEYRNKNLDKIRAYDRELQQKLSVKEAKRYVAKLRWEIKNRERRRQMAKEYYRKNKEDIIKKKRLRRHALKETAENPHVKGSS